MTNAPTDPLLGSTVFQYSIVAKLGGGGMGVVYKATDTKLGRVVALKFLPPQWSHDEGAKQRFLREAQAASATNHRNICVIHDIEQTDDGRLFIVMAYYEGQTLKEKLEGGPLPVSEALEIASGVAEGLAKAHAQLVVHRDIKPGNLIVTDDGVKILDFGLAKFADALQLTIQGSTIGTVAYMSPEQARGEEADARSDVWALGVVLYQMLTGEVPFKGSYEEAVFYAIKNEPLPALRVAGGEVPEALEALVLRALEKDPGKRYQSARELAHDLRVMQGRTVPVDLLPSRLPKLAPESLWRRMRRAVTPVRAAAALAVLLAVAAGSYRWLTRPVVRIVVAAAPVANHTGKPELDPYRLALTETLIGELLESPNIRAVSYTRLAEVVRPFALGAGDVSGSEAIQAIATRSGARFIVLPSLEYRDADGSLQARVQVRSVETGTTTSTYETEAVTSSLPKDAVYRLMPSLADRLQQHFKTHGPGRSYSRRAAGSRFRNVEAARSFEEGLNAFGQLEYAAALTAFRSAASQDEQNAMAHAWLSRVSLLLHRDNDAGESARRAKALVTQETSPANGAVIEGILAETRKDFAAAEEQYRRLAHLEPDDPAAQIELADFLKRRSRNQEAVEAYLAVLRLDSGYIRPYVDLCQLYSRLDDQPLAETHARTALDQFRTAGNPAGEAQALLCFGEAQRVEGGARLVEARQNIEKARGIFESLGQAYGLARVHQYLGILALSEQNYAAAAQSFEQALPRSRQVGDRELEGVVLMNLGVTHFRFGHVAQALGYFRQSQEVYEQIGDERRAAEQMVNAANLQISYGIDGDKALNEIISARAALRKLGYVSFEVLAMQGQATAYTNAGRHTEARRQLEEALNIARERKITERIPSISVDLAESYLLTNEYEAARARLETLVASDAGRDYPKGHATLGRTYARLGDVKTATTYLEKALRATEATRQTALAPRVYESLGELAYQSGRLEEARRLFVKASGYWTDDLPEGASVEARSYQGLIDAVHRRDSAGKQKVQSSLDQAKKMGHLDSEALCRLHLARIELHEGRYSDALSTLDGIPLAGDKTIGRELEAEVHYWRGQAMAKRGEAAAAHAEGLLARKLMRELQESLPGPYRDSFASRADVRPLLEWNLFGKGG